MQFITEQAKWVMLVSGVLTATMFYGLFAPQAALDSMFGISFTGQLENIIIRSWSALVGLIGVMLIYGFFDANLRRFSFTVAGFSKMVFVSLVLIYGQAYITKVLPAILMDIVVIMTAILYLMATAKQR